MSLEEAKQITATFSGTFVPPPRTITDVTELLKDTPARAQTLSELIRAVADRPTRTTDDPMLLGRFYWLRGRAARHLGRIQQSLEDLTRAAQTIPPYRGGKEPNGVSDLGLVILQELAEAHAAGGNIREAIKHYENLIRSVAQFDQGFLFRPYGGVVQAYIAVGDLKAAERATRELQTLFDLSRRSLNGLPHVIATRESTMASAEAIVLESAGRFVDAERAWRKSIAALTPHQDRDWIAARLDDHTGRLSQCLVRQGRLVEAEVEARAALRSALSRANPFAFDVPGLATQLARVLREQGRYREAGALAQAAITIYEHGGALPTAALSVVEPRRELAVIAVAQQRWDAALREYERVRELLQDEALYRRLTERDPALAVALLRAGRRDEAATILAAALDSSRRLFGDKHPSTAELRGLGAIALATRGDVSGARKEFAAAATVLLNSAEHVDDESTSQGEQEQRRTWILGEYVDLLTRTRSPGVTPTETDAVAEAFRIAEGARGGIVQRALGAAIARSAATTPALADLARREQDAAKQIAALQGLLAATVSGEAKDAEADLRKRIEALRRARQALVQEIEQKFPAYTELINPRPATIERVRAALRPREALLATYVGEERTYVWAVPKSGPVAFAVVPLGASAIGASVAMLRKALDSGARMLQDIPAFDVGVAHELYRQILEPVKAAWEPASSLIVVAHGPLTQIPWTLLPTRAVPLGPERAPLFSNYRAIPWLVRTHAVTVVPAVATLAALRALPPGDPQRRPFVGFGDPYFSVAHARRGSAERVAALSARGGLTLRDVAVSPGADVQESRLAMLPPLPDTADEIRAMARALGADEARDVFLGIAANERNVKTLELSRYRVIAFATHGLVPGDIDGLTQPALALTAPEVAKVEGDGLLTMEKILALRLNADWVVLSACNTANGAGAGAEAISGLGRAFFYAGARALLVTLWPVETTSAKALTTEIFRRQATDATLTRAKALQHTINAMIDDGGLIDPSTGRMTFSYAHPLFWAPFVLVGDGG